MQPIGWYWWDVRGWCRRQPERLAWWLAWSIPRKVALFAFIRVFGATITELSWDRDDLYRKCYDGWERGNGK
jgi:hypothetical protein